MALYLLKVRLQTFLSIPITQKCQILSCDTLVANEPYTGKTFVKIRTQPQIIILLGESVRCAVFSPVQCLQAHTTQFQERAVYVSVIIFSILEDSRYDDIW